MSASGSKRVQTLLDKLDRFDDELRGMEAQSRVLRDLYTDMSEFHGARVASLAKRHTRHLIPPQHTARKNIKLQVEVRSNQGPDTKR